MSNEQDENITDKLNEVYPISSGNKEWDVDEDYSKTPADHIKGKIPKGLGLIGLDDRPAQIKYTLEEFLEQVKHMRYHQPIYKQLKAILKAQGHWKDLKKGGSFGAGNPYRFTKHE